jgi:hypothetical protein
MAVTLSSWDQIADQMVQESPVLPLACVNSAWPIGKQIGSALAASYGRMSAALVAGGLE